MKISNETKVGALTAIAITLLILGFNFLKGKSLFKSGNFIYAKFKDSKHLMVSNPVFIKGLQIGAVYELEEANKNLDSIIVSIKLSKDVNIPDSSFASINESPLGGSSVVITMVPGKNYLKSGDYIATADFPGILEGLTGKAAPVFDQIKTTVNTMDSVLRNINSVFDPYTKNNLQDVVANFNKITLSLILSSKNLERLMNAESGMIAKSIGNLNSVTGNLAGNNEKINATIANLQTTSQNFSQADIKGSVDQLKTAVATFQSTIAKMDSREGSLGLLLNDKQLYHNLANTTRSLNILMDDLRVNPKRYTNLNITLFGRKSNAAPLTAPTTVTVLDTAVVQ